MNPAGLSAHQRMELHINTLFCCDAEGKLRAVNEHGEPPAPLFYMGRTPTGNLWRFRYDLPTTLAQELDQLCRSEPVTADLASPPQNYRAIRTLLQGAAPATTLQEYRGPAYWIPPGRAASIQPGTNPHIVIISAHNAHLLENNFAWMLPFDAFKGIEPVVAAVEQGQAVAICFCSRRPAQATEAGVETVAEFRGRGYATAVVALWANEVSRRGCLPLYSTAWDNLASQSVARKLQMVLYGEDWSIT